MVKIQNKLTHISNGQSRKYIFFLHGTGNDHFYPYFEVFECFKKQGYSIFTFDLDGHGAQSSSILDSATIISSTRKIFQDFKEKYSPQEVIVVGHSLGAVLAMTIPCEKRILISPPLELKITFSVILNEFLYLLDRDCFRQIKNYGLWGSLPAFGKFKRKAFPMRLKEKRNYLEVIGEILRSAQDDRVDSNDYIVFGDKDLVAPQVKMDGKTYIVKGASHSNILFKKSLFSSLDEINRDDQKNNAKSGN